MKSSHCIFLCSFLTFTLSAQPQTTAEQLLVGNWQLTHQEDESIFDGIELEIDIDLPCTGECTSTSDTEKSKYAPELIYSFYDDGTFQLVVDGYIIQEGTYQITGQALLAATSRYVIEECTVDEFVISWSSWGGSTTQYFQRMAMVCFDESCGQD